MDWFLLLLVVPLILVPIVLLCGFSGCTRIGLHNACEHDYDCASGQSCVDNRCAWTEAPGVPARPDNLVAASVSESQIDLTWENADPTAPDSFQVERHGENESDFVAIPGAPAPLTVENFSDQGLPEGTTFFYQVKACNTVGCSEPSDRDSARATTLPKAPSNLMVTGVTVDQIDLGWSNNSGRPGILFSIEHRPNTGSAFTEIFRGAATTFSHRPLAEGSDHEYQVIALLAGFQAGDLGDVSSTPSARVQAATLPAAPSNLIATTIGVDQIDLNWTNSSARPGIQFSLEHRLDAASAFTEIFRGTAAAFSHTALADGSDHEYRVTALFTVNPAGTPQEVRSTPSAVVLATTLPAAPSNLIGTPVSVSQIDLNWTNNSVRPGIQFSLEHRLDAASAFAQIFRGTAATFSHTALAEGSGHEYRVTALFTVNPAGTPQELKSTPSAAIQARTWAVALQAPLAIDQGGLQGFCLVDRIRSALLSTNPRVPLNGTRVRITVRGSSAGGLTVDRLYISRVASAPGSNAYDSLAAGVAGGLTRVVDASLGDPPVVLPPNTARTLAPVAFDFLRTEDLLVAFDFNAAVGQGNVRAVSLTGSDIFVRANTQQASVADRAPNATDAVPFMAGNPGGIHYLVEKLEVL